MNTIFILVAMCVGVLVIFNLLRTAIIKNRFLPSMRSAVLTFFPPQDIYLPLLTIALISKDSNHCFEGEFRHTCGGKYQLGVQVAKKISMLEHALKSDLRISVKFYSAGVQVFAAHAGDTLTPWWGHDENGFMLIDYWVPHDLPIDVAIKCEVELEKLPNEFMEKYGAATLYIKKSSEK